MARGLWRAKAIALLIVLGLCAAACGDDGSASSSTTTAAPTPGATAAASTVAPASGEPVVIGVVLALTGSFGVIGQAAQQGLAVAVKRVNAAGGVLGGRPLKLEVRDSGSDVNKGILAARELMDKACPCAFIAPDIISTISLGILPVTTERKIVTISGASAVDVGNATKYPYSYQLSYNSDTILNGMAAALVQLKAAKVGTLFPTSAAGTERSGKAPAAFQKVGLTVVGSEKFEPGATDMTVQVQKLKNAGADTIACSGAGKENGAIMSAVRDLGWTSVTVLCDVAAVAGGAVESIPAEVAKQYHYLGALGATRSGASADNAFLQDLKKEGGTIDSLDTRMLNHDIIQIAAWAINKAGSIDGEKVNAALESIGSAGKELTDKLIYFSNPGWVAGSHGTEKTDYSKFWAIVDVSPLVDGTYIGKPVVGVK